MKRHPNKVVLQSYRFNDLILKVGLARGIESEETFCVNSARAKASDEKDWLLIGGREAEAEATLDVVTGQCKLKWHVRLWPCS